MGTALIGPDKTWLLWAFLTGWAAFSIYLEQKYDWASKVTGAIIALVGAMALSNFGIIPLESPVYDTVWGFVVPLAIPMLLFKADVNKIWKESGRALIIYLLSSIGTLAGSMIAFMALHNQIPELYKVAAMITGSYIGGGVNFVAMSESFKAPGDVVSATVVADNLLMALYFFVLISIPTIKFFKKHFTHPLEDAIEKNGSSGENKAAAYWGAKEISLKDIAFSFGVSVVIVAVSMEIASFFSTAIPTSNGFSSLFNSLLGNKYLIMTTLTMILATAMPKFFTNIKGAQEIGTFLIYIFFVVIGVPASIPMIIQNSPLLLVFCGIVVAINMLVSFSLGKIFKFDLEEIILASNANIGGPTTAAAMAIAKGWHELVVPYMLVGVLGYVIGSYAGIFMGNFFMGF